MELAELKDEDLINRPAKSAKPSFFSRKYLINPKVQIAYSFAAAWMILVTMGVTAMVVYYTFSSILFDPAYQMAEHKALEVAHSAIFKRLLWIGFILVASGVTLTIYFLHRLVGPIYRLEQVLKAASHGALPPSINLRKHDEFHDLAKALLNMLNTIGRTPSGAYAVIQNAVEEVPEEHVKVETSGFAAQSPAEGAEESSEEDENSEEGESSEDDGASEGEDEADEAQSDEGKEQEEGDKEVEPSNDDEREATESDDAEQAATDDEKVEGDSVEDDGKQKD
jgi:hypothetical protein